MRSETAEGETTARNPIRGIFVVCCASANEQRAKTVALRTTRLNLVFICTVYHLTESP